MFINNERDPRLEMMNYFVGRHGIYSTVGGGTEFVTDSILVIVIVIVIVADLYFKVAWASERVEVALYVYVQCSYL
jgi:hypothetical protein